MDIIDADERAAYYASIVQQFSSRTRNQVRSAYNSNGANNTRIKFSTTFRNVIYDVLISRGYDYTDDTVDWDIMWCDKMYIRAVYSKIYLSNNQFINHYRNFYELCRKDCLIRNLRKYKKLLLQQCTSDNERTDILNELSFWPDTYILPTEYYIFAKSFKDDTHNTTATTQYIMKPIASSQGKGIFLFDRLSDISDWKLHIKSIQYSNINNKRQPISQSVDDDVCERYIVQRYIDRPLLIGGKKFDMRIYALVTSFAPLTVWLYRDGFARFASTRYSMLNCDISNNLVHLTNVAVQKHGELYDGDNTGGKMDLTALKKYLCTVYGEVVTDRAFVGIENIIVHSLRAVSSCMINDSQSFELYGYDVLLDSELKPWLIEVNGSPSLTASTQHDKKMKFDLLNDMLNVIDMEKIRVGNEIQMGGFDLLVDKNQRLQKYQRNTVSSYLGNSMYNRNNNRVNTRRSKCSQ